MEFRRNGGRDERRRRVLMDESTSAEETSGAEASGAPSARSSKRDATDYTAAAEASRQLRLSDLVPRKGWLVALFSFTSLLVAGAIVAAAWYSPQWAWLDDTTRLIFAADARGNLTSWFASLVMLLCAVGAMQIYLLRRHKANDYRGRYRLWNWVAGLFLLASASAVVGLHDLMAIGLRAVVPASWSIDSSLLAMAPLAVIMLAVGIRLTIETRHSYGTLAALACCGICYAFCGVAWSQPGWLTHLGASDSHAIAVIGLGSQLAGHTMLLLGVMLFARYVHLAANGLLKVRPPRKRREKKPAAKKAATEATTSEPKRESAKPKPAKTKRKRTKATPPPVEKVAPQSTAPEPKSSTEKSSNSSDAPAPATLSLEELAEREDLTARDTAHLSKAERRRLRKLQRRSNRAA